MKKMLTAVLITGILALTTAWSSELMSSSNSGGVSSLRGNVAISAINQSESLKKNKKDSGLIDLGYITQPPLIPHKIRGYRIDVLSNKCLSCHSWKNANENNATKISVTHFRTRDGAVLSDVSPRRYFCLQCHVPQTDAKLIVGNSFKPVKALQ
ncbi:MAG: nitrate reductase cytochrome c-type subunit [Psychromonas sp.]|nr:nitrate reductase cytochrome c-type subunit [Psychromonas sp.]